MMFSSIFVWLRRLGLDPDLVQILQNTRVPRAKFFVQNSAPSLRLAPEIS